MKKSLIIVLLIALSATNGQAIEKSVTVSLTVNGIPVVEPVDTTVVFGTEVVFSVVPTGLAPVGGYTYSWSKGSTALGVTSQTHTITNADMDDGGDYTCVVVNGTGPIVSQVAHLTVQEPPLITQEPIPKTVEVGQPFSLTVSASPVNGCTLSYQWKKYDSGAWTAVGTDSNIYNVVSAQLPDADNYTVDVSCGTIIDPSNIVSVTVNPASTPMPRVDLVYTTGTNTISVTFKANGYSCESLITGASDWTTEGFNKLGLRLIKTTAPTNTLASTSCNTPVDASSTNVCDVTSTVLNGFNGKLAPYMQKDTGTTKFPNRGILEVYLTKNGVGPTLLTRSDGNYFDLDLR